MGDCRVGAAPDAQRPTCPLGRPSRRRPLGRFGGLAEGLEEPLLRTIQDVFALPHLRAAITAAPPADLFVSYP